MTSRANQNVTCAIKIEGIGLDVLDPTATRFAYGCDLNLFAGGTSGSIRIGTLAKLPRTVSTIIDPINGSYQVEPINIELTLNSEINAALRQKAFLEIGSISSGMDDAQTIVPLAVPGLDSTVIYINHETIMLGVYNGTNAYTGCTRGYHESTPTDHKRNRNCYDLVPSWRNRLVTFETFDDVLCVWVVRWRGYLKEKRSTEKDTILILRCVSLLSALKDAQINRDSPDLRKYGFVSVNDRTIRPLLGAISYYSRVRKLGQTTSPMVVVAGKAILLVPRRSAADYSLTRAEIIGYTGTGQAADENPVSAKGEIREILVVSQDLDNKYGNVSFTHNLKYPYHPCSIALALMSRTSRATEDTFGYNVTNPAWSLPVNEWLDFFTWEAIIEETK